MSEVEKSDFNCGKCTDRDHGKMVQCDQCNKWYHYECVEVGDEVANISWVCEACVDFRPHESDSDSALKQPTAIPGTASIIASSARETPVSVSTPIRDTTPVKYTCHCHNKQLTFMSSHGTPNHAETGTQQHVDKLNDLQHADNVNGQQHATTMSKQQQAEKANGQQNAAITSKQQYARYANGQQQAAVHSTQQPAENANSQQHAAVHRMQQHAASANG